jgi:hypothetical protein
MFFFWPSTRTSTQNLFIFFFYNLIKRVFSNVVMVIFQINFYAQIYVNNFFYFLKIIFDIST